MYAKQIAVGVPLAILAAALLDCPRSEVTAMPPVDVTEQMAAPEAGPSDFDWVISQIAGPWEEFFAVVTDGGFPFLPYENCVEACVTLCGEGNVCAMCCSQNSLACFCMDDEGCGWVPDDPCPEASFEAAGPQAGVD